MMKVSLALAAVLVLAGCSEPRPKAPPPAPAPPVPPTPDLPITAAKARQIIGDLPLGCIEMASLKADMATCDARIGKPVDQAALRTELRDLRWNLQALPREEASRRCAAITDELRAKPKPQACWDLGVG